MKRGKAKLLSSLHQSFDLMHSANEKEQCLGTSQLRTHSDMVTTKCFLSEEMKRKRQLFGIIKYFLG